MSQAMAMRLKRLEARVAELEARLNQPVEPPPVPKRGPGRPRKEKAASDAGPFTLVKENG